MQSIKKLFFILSKSNNSLKRCISFSLLLALLLSYFESNLLVNISDLASSFSHPNSNSLVPRYASILVVLSLLVSLSKISLHRLNLHISSSLGIFVSSRIVSNICGVSYSQFVELDRSDVVTSVTRKLDHLVSITSLFFQSISSFLTLLFVVTTLLSLNPAVFTFVFALFALLIYSIYQFTSPILKKNSINVALHESEALSHLLEFFTSYRYLHSFNLFKTQANRFVQSESNYRRRSSWGSFLVSLPKLFIESVIYIFSFALLFLFPNFFLTNVALISTMAIALQRSFPLIQQLLTTSNLLSSTKQSISDVYRFFVLATSRSHDKSNISLVQYHSNISTLELQNLSISILPFSLSNPINHSFSSEHINVIAGPSGSGKTTLINCILGLTPHLSGSITYRSTHSNSLSPSSLSYLSDSDPPIFPFNATENILLGKDSLIPFDDCLKTACIDSLLPKLDHDLSGAELKAKLSRGQLQRLSIARCISHNPPILLLDEALSGVPEYQEISILERLHLLLPSTIIIVVSHRLSVQSLCPNPLIFD